MNLILMPTIVRLLDLMAVKISSKVYESSAGWCSQLSYCSDPSTKAISSQHCRLMSVASHFWLSSESPCLSADDEYLSEVLQQY